VQRRSVGSLWYPEAYRVGPVGVVDPHLAAGGVGAVTAWALQHSGIVRMAVPGSHPALPKLLEAGFEITYAEQFMHGGGQEPFDPACYVPSGGLY